MLPESLACASDGHEHWLIPKVAAEFQLVGEVLSKRVLTYAEAMRDDGYLRATEEVLKARHGLWFWDESFVISRKRDL